MKNIIFLLVMATLLLSSSCNKEEMIVFDITVMNKDNSVVTEGSVLILGTEDGFTGTVIIFRKRLSLQNGKVKVETPFDPKIADYQVTYEDKSNNRPSQTIVGCNHEFDSFTCDMSKGERKFVIDITLR